MRTALAIAILLPVLALGNAERFVEMGVAGLALVSFLESSFFPLPPDFIQIALTLASPSQAFYFATVSTAASTLGSLLGWVIGRYAGESFFAWLIRKRIVKQGSFDQAKILLLKYDVGAIFIAAFTPIPYKVFTIASGICRIGIARLLIASMVGRGARFFLVATVLHYGGEAAQRYVSGPVFAIATLALGVVVVGVGAVVYRLRRRRAALEARVIAEAQAALTPDLSHAPTEDPSP